VDGEATALNLVAVGMGLSFIVAANDESPLPDVVFKSVVELNNVLTLALVWPETSSSPLAHNFVQTVGGITQSQAAP